MRVRDHRATSYYYSTSDTHRWAFEVERGAEARENAPHGYPVHDDYPPTCHHGRHVSPPVVRGRLVSEENRHGDALAYPGAQFGGHSSAHASAYPGYPGQQTRGVPTTMH